MRRKEAPGTHVIHEEDLLGVVLELVLRPSLVHHPDAWDPQLLSGDRHLRTHDGVAEDHRVVRLPRWKSSVTNQERRGLLQCFPIPFIELIEVGDRAHGTGICGRNGVKR